MKNIASLSEEIDTSKNQMEVLELENKVIKIKAQ